MFLHNVKFFILCSNKQKFIDILQGLTVDGLIGTMCPDQKMNILKPETQSNFPEDCPISGFFGR